MSWSVHIYGTHAERGQAVQRTVDACPVILGRDRALAAFPIEGDDSVSKVHASIDVWGDRLMVRDVRSTNGTFTRAGRLDPDRWVDVGPADLEHELRVGGWCLRVSATRAAASPERPMAASAPSTTVPESAPFGASQSTTVGEAGGDEFLSSFAPIVDRLSERVHALQIARSALEEAVAAAVAGVAEDDRPSLRTTLARHYPELTERTAEAAAPPPPAGSTAASVAALSTVRELATRYAGAAPESPGEIAVFKRRLRSGLDAFVHGLVEALAGVTAYADEMSVLPGPTAAQFPRTSAELVRAVFGASDGGELVRRAFHEVAIHQVASFNAVLSGVRELLGELSPEAIEAASSRELARAGFWRRLWLRLFPARRLLAAYRRRHRDLSTEESARFALIFGRRFADEYHATMREARPPAKRRPSGPPPLPAQAPAPPARAEGDARGGTVPLAPRLVSRGGNVNKEGTAPMAPTLRPGAPRGGNP